MTRQPGRMRRRILAAAMLASVALVATACGVPSSGKPIVDGPATTMDSITGSGGVVLSSRPGDFAANQKGAGDFIESGYLTAAAGQVPGKATQTAVTAFMNDKLRQSRLSQTQQTNQINVVRIKDSSVTPTPTGFLVTERVLEVGVFDPQSGLLSAPPANALDTLKFSIANLGAGRAPGARGPVPETPQMLLTAAPNGLYMTEDVLHESQYYQPQVIYFWDVNHGLIPDLRYQSAGLTSIQRATAVVSWILAGPPPWIPSNIAARTTPGMALVDNTLPATGNTFIVNLPPTAQSLSKADLGDLAAQIRWSLGDIRADPSQSDVSAVQLQIGNQPKLLDKDNAYVSKNQAPERTGAPTMYAIDGGKVRPIAKGPALSVLPNVAPNKNVLLAAVAVDSSRQLAAFVRSVGSKQQLWVRRGDKTIGPIMTASSFKRPVWLEQPEGALAFIADGKFFVWNGKNQPLNVTVPNLGKVDAFSVAPDSRQVALVSDGRLWTSLLETGDQPSASAPPSLTAPRLIDVRPALSSVTGVAWSAVTQMVVAGPGPGGGTAIDISVDGTYVNRIPLVKAFGDTRISQIVSYPLSPLVEPLTGSPYVMMQTTGGACIGRASCTPGSLTWSPATPTGPQPAWPFYAD